MDNTTIVSFHIGRGGRFFNGGCKTYIGEKNFQEILQMNSQYIFIQDRDEKGRFCTPYITDESGNVVCDDNVNGLTGVLDLDGDYDTYISKYYRDCTDEEIELIEQ